MWNFEDVRIGQGKTPEDINSQLHKHCSRFVGGAWATVQASQLLVERISGGLLNQNYRCQLPDDVKSVGDEPREVAVRLYHRFDENDPTNFKPTRTNDLVIALLAGEHRLGPAIYGLFEEGEIQEFVRSHWFSIAEQNDSKMLLLYARHIAKFNSMKVPMEKNDGRWLLEKMRKFYHLGCENFDIDKLVDKLNLETIKNTDFLAEIDWLDQLAAKTRSPIVFCHADLVDANILVRDSWLDGRPVRDEEKLVFIDYDWSMYGYRGYDLAFQFVDWGRTSVWQQAQFPPEETLKMYLKAYIEEYHRINGKTHGDRDEMENLIREVKVFFLVHIMRQPVAMIFLPEFSEIRNKERMLMSGENHLKMYFEFKKLFIEEKAITE